jgi:flagellar motility protein MotE (MotC chaperone)
MNITIDWWGIIKSNIPESIFLGLLLIVILYFLIRKLFKRGGGKKMDVNEIEKNAFKERLAVLYQQIQDRRGKQAQEEFELLQKLRDKNKNDLDRLEEEYRYLYDKVK